MILLHRAIVMCVLATTMHVPVPVFDGDDLKSGELRTMAAADDRIDVDFILLGCDPPDDSDDGPVDDDPENGSNSIFGPVFSCLKPSCQSAISWQCHLNGYACSSGDRPDRTGITAGRVEVAGRDSSFGKRCPSSKVILRC